MKSLRSASLCAVAALAVALSGARDADACGGCFTTVIPSETESTVVSAHRMAFAISPTHTVLWDQIQYTGAPESFAWVLPVKAGATIDVASDAFFEVLEAATSARVVSPEVYCSAGGGGPGCGIGCGASAYGGDFGSPVGGTPPPVTVVHAGTVGPYETVTLHANVPNALPNWLASHGYVIDPSVSPVINDYVAEGFDFIALRLLPDKTVREMQPVRVTTQGISPVLPLRMVAAGTGPNVSIALFVISEGLYVPQNFPVSSVTPSSIGWSFITNESNYAEKRADLLAKDSGRTWNLAYGRHRPFLSPIGTLARGETEKYTIGTQEMDTIAEAYVAQGQANGDMVDTSCVNKMINASLSSSIVTNLCSSQGGGGGGGGGGAGGGGAGAGGGAGGAGGGTPNCASPGPGQIDMRDFICGELNDLAVAFEGLHPKDVWLTRLEANLPHSALADDLVLEAASNQVEVDNWFYADHYAGDPCAQAGLSSASASPRRQDRSMAAFFGVTLLSLGAAALRRIRRRR